MERIQKRVKREKGIMRGYLLASLLLFLAYGASFYANKRLVKQSRLVEHSNIVIRKLEIMLSSLKDGETSIRGYIITKNADFLPLFYASRGKTYSYYEDVLQLTADNPLQQDRLRQLKPNIDKRYDLFGSVVSVFDLNNKSITDSLVGVMEESKKKMDEIRVEVGRLQDHEAGLLTARDDQLQKTFMSVNVITITSVSIAFLLIIFSFITYIRGNRGIKQALKEIADYQQQLKSRVEELDQANAELLKMRSQEKYTVTGRIARTIAHEVRNPLTNIKLAVDQLRSESIVKDENSVRLFEILDRNSTRINQLVSDLLGSTSYTELSYEKVSVNDLLDEALQQAGDRIALTNIKVVKEYSAGICAISVDKTKVRIALLNLIINALESMENKKDAVLHIETKAEDHKCKITITDNGSGMDGETVERMFEPFFTNKNYGNGLGLTNTQNIILLHKGSISVESSLGKGTSFIITLDIT